MKTLILASTTLALATSVTAQWAQLSPAASPSGRGTHGMAYNPITGGALVFGGDTFGFSGATDETWSFDGSTWTNLMPSGGVSAAVGVGMVYDFARGVFVTYGSLATGFFGGPSVDATWEYDPIGNAWTQVFPVTTPGGLGLYGMSYDLVRSRVVLYGGLPNSFFPIDAGDTWEFDGTDWALITTAASPGPLERPGMCFHNGIAKTVLFGGIDVQIGGTDTTWLFDGTNWTAATVTGVKPSARTGCALAYDSDRQVCVMTGGQDAVTNLALNDTWELTLDSAGNGSWVLVPSTYADARLNAGVVYLPSSRQVLMFGGLNYQTFVASADTQSYGAKSATFGTGCAGSNGTPALDATDAPRLGASFDLNATNLNTTFNTAIFLQSLTSVAPAPLDSLGMIGCTGYVAPTVITAITGAGGSATLTIAIPSSLALMGTVLNTQAVSLDPNINALWLVAANAHTGTLGN